MGLRGEESDEYAVKKLLSRYGDSFLAAPLGDERRLTIRGPNPDVEESEAKVLLEILESIPRSYDAAATFYGEHDRETVAPIHEVIVPMVTDAGQLDGVCPSRRRRGGGGGAGVGVRRPERDAPRGDGRCDRRASPRRRRRRRECPRPCRSRTAVPRLSGSSGRRRHVERCRFVERNVRTGVRVIRVVSIRVERVICVASIRASYRVSASGVTRRRSRRRSEPASSRPRSPTRWPRA